MLNCPKLSAPGNDHNVTQPVICISPQLQRRTSNAYMYSASILEIIVDRRPLALRHTLLLPIHLRYLSRGCSHVRLLIIPHADESWESQTDSLLSINAFLTARFIPWTQRQVGSLDFPDVAWLEPDVGLVLITRGVGVEGFRAVDGDGGKLGVEFFEDSFAEAGADVADSFVGVGSGITAG